MSNLLEVTGDDVAQLSDADLRTLIGMLCEADYRLAGLPTNGIRWGGNQDAPDGGFDVVVRHEVPPPQNSFVPKNSTAFQVKKTKMPKSEIVKEMCPGDVLRQEIKSLIGDNGAYIIVSSSDSTTDTALKSRVGAMRDAVRNEPQHEKLHLDFYDRGRIATWVRAHFSLMVWVRNNAGRSLSGWCSYENWANAPGGTKEEYLFDDALRLRDGTKTEDEGLSAQAGLVKLRSILSGPATSVRLAGLSGVGKTRLVQALFDERVGENALNPTQAIYSDVADDPSPDPITLATQLINEKRRVILILDNCPPALHKRLTDICSTLESTVSLLTVEYDVRDDVPENTTVFRLEPASEVIIERLIRKRFSHISQVDARTIANFSGGNARVAISLANTVQGGETLSSLRNEQLFERLFWQRHDPSDRLLKSAEALSLVYSFEGTDATSENSELQFLGSLIDVSASDVYRHVAELKGRDLIQARNVWRAVLPQAIANRLARRALESIPRKRLLEKFVNDGSERLIVSFARRLSFLHDSVTVVDIVTEWLKPNGWIGKSINNLGSFGMTVFSSIAPVAPERTLEVIERVAKGPEGSSFTSRENRHYAEFVRLLRQLAYDPSLFERSALLIARYALSENKDENNNSSRDVLKSLFFLYLSGTQARLEAKTRLVEGLLNSANEDRQELGLLLLDATLEAWHFGSHHEFDFGARPRDFGYEPKGEEITQWFTTFLGICERLAVSGSHLAEKARKILADHFRGLWTRARLFDQLERPIRRIQAQGAWNEGWIAVRETLRYDGKYLTEELKERLRQLERLLKPGDLLEQARIFAFSHHHRIIDLTDENFDKTKDPAITWRKADEATRNIGAQVAQSADVFKVLLPELVSKKGPRLTTFGRGLAKGANNKLGVFGMLRAELEKTPAAKLIIKK